MVVMKFGGSSLISARSFLQIANIIQSNKFMRKVVVLSAMGGVTNVLVDAIDNVLKIEFDVLTVVDSIRRRHVEVVEEAILKDSIRSGVLASIEDCLSQLTKLLQGAALTGEVTARLEDAILAMGERMSVRLMAGVLHEIGVDAAAVDSDVIGVPAEGPYGQANADLDLARRRLPDAFAPYFSKSIIPLVTGFFGQNECGETLTFGRGGSDYAAAVLANALCATRLEIWKDVDGFLSVSPEILEQGRLLQSLSYDEAAELAYFGAGILHPRTVEPLLERQIPVVIRNVFKPDGLGTWIDSDQQKTEPVVKSVTFDRNIGLLRIYGVDVGYTVGLLGKIVNSLSSNRINIRSVMTSQTCINLLLDKVSLRPAHHLLEALSLRGIDTIESRANLGLVALVGEGLDEAESCLGRLMMALHDEDIHIELTVAGASRVAAYIIVREDALNHAVETVHHAIFNS
ncbi:aspartate kinase [bacterium]|nr:aspartate kinase [bacterium]